MVHRSAQSVTAELRFHCRLVALTCPECPFRTLRLHRPLTQRLLVRTGVAMRRLSGYAYRCDPIHYEGGE